VPLNQVVLYKVPPWKEEVLQGRVAFSPSSTVTFDRVPRTTTRGNDEWMRNEKFIGIWGF